VLFLKTFKKPLSPEEEKYYLEKYKEGDTAARNLLIEHNLRLVAHIAKKYQAPEHDTDDLISIGIIGLIKAVMTFDSGKNNKLATYAARCIENELLMMLRSRKKLTREVSMYEKIGVDQEGRELRLMDVLESEPVDILENLETQRNISQLRSCICKVLNERELLIICERYGLCGMEEKTQREIATSLGISRSYVSRLEKRALEKLKDAFEEDLTERPKAVGI
jgi:RNA polymerase sporulation-specific sigma factor